MNPNVMIFGAGISRDAGVPLLGTFVDCMLDMAMRGKCRDKPLTPADREVFDAAVKVRERLDGYHGRAAFDDRNIEDVLSILAMSANGGSRADKKMFRDFVKAIARTIDLRCELPIAKLNHARQEGGAGLYGKFWKSLISRAQNSTLPTIISLNYDLVLERSLIATLSGDNWSPSHSPFPYDSICLRYHCATHADRYFAVKQSRFQGRDFGNDYWGYALEPIEGALEKCLQVDILKLHGSLNFPRSAQLVVNFQSSIDDPLIMPPVFIKTGDKSLEPVWAKAMEALRSAVNIIICGYSLPVSDTYMQYFLKAALGPNRDLSKIAVFDPALSSKSALAQAMMERYSEVFSHQIRNRIHFDPPGGDGTFGGLVSVLEKNATALLY